MYCRKVIGDCCYFLPINIVEDNAKLIVSVSFLVIIRALILFLLATKSKMYVVNFSIYIHQASYLSKHSYMHISMGTYVCMHAYVYKDTTVTY